MADAFLPDDLLQYERIRDIDASPIDATIACAIETAASEDDTYRSAIWLYTAEHGRLRKLTAGEKQDYSPRWSPDGRNIAFLSNRNGGIQVYLIPYDGGEAHQLCDFPMGVLDLQWSPDGTSLAVIASVDNTPDSMSGEASPDGVDVEVVSRLPYKLDGLGYTLSETSHLFLIDLASETYRQLTYGRYEVRSLAWSSDGKALFIARTRDETLAQRTDLWRIEVAGGTATQLTSTVAMAQTPRPSPNGKFIVFDGSENDGDAQIRLWLYACESGAVSGLGSSDIEVVDGASITWDHDSNGITFLLARCGLQEIAHLSVKDGEYRQVVGGAWHISDFRLLETGQIVFQAESPCMTNQLFVHEDGCDQPRRLTHLNSWWREEKAPAFTLRRFTVPDGDGGSEEVDGWVVTPRSGADPGPLLIDIHGGPSSYALLAYTSHPYWPILVEKGWSILALNAVGSSSYGRAFATRLHCRWGDMDLAQHLAAADVLADEGVCNGKVALIGKSYGGYATAWAISQGRKFDAAVILAPLTTLETHYGTSDSGYYADRYELDGTPSDGDGDTRPSYILNSPARYAPRVNSPVLMLHGKDDQRCPVSQSEDFFVRILTQCDVPAEMVLYPGASHHFLETGKPSQRVDIVRRTVAWLERFGQQQRRDSSH